jgi:hypothetical protein
MIHALVISIVFIHGLKHDFRSQLFDKCREMVDLSCMNSERGRHRSTSTRCPIDPS